MIPLEIDCATVKARLDSGDDLVLIDCREDEEYAAACIAEARLVPMSEITTRLDELEEFRNRRLVVHCHHGGRSLKVASWLRDQGFEQVQSMAGGIEQWSLEIDPTVPRY